MPAVGEEFICYKTKKEALDAVLHNSTKETAPEKRVSNDPSKTSIPIILKTDTAGSLDALVYEIAKLGNDRVEVKIVLSGIGPISENDVRSANTNANALIVGFHTKVEPQAESLALRMGIAINSFDIIYKLTEWLAVAIQERTPSIEVEEMVGRAKILKTFSKTKDKQIIGGRVEEGTISVGENVRIMRREAFIGTGRVRELQEKKQKTSSITEGNEFGSMIESKIELAPGDKVESFTLVKK
jgi:translation initiation factor IF-2